MADIRVEILTHGRILMKGKVDSVGLPGTEGRFTILRNHAPLIASLEAGDIVCKTGSLEIRHAIRSGFVEVRNNNVIVCVEE